MNYKPYEACGHNIYVYNEYVKDGLVKIVHVNSVDNDDNILKNNLGNELHEVCSRKMLSEKDEENN